MLLFESLRLEMESSIFPVWIEGSQLRFLDDKGITLTDEIANVAEGRGQGRILCIKKKTKKLCISVIKVDFWPNFYHRIIILKT